MVIEINSLVCIRLDGFGERFNCWFRVSSINYDNYKFQGVLERKVRSFDKYKIGESVELSIYDVTNVYDGISQFCYSDNVTICECKGLCYDK